LHEDRHEQLRRVARELEQVGRDEQRLLAAIKQGGQLDVLVGELKSLQARGRELRFELQQLQKVLPPPIELPSTRAIRKAFEATFVTLAMDSSDFADCMRKIIDKIIVFPVRLVDGGNPFLRARFDVNLSSYLPES